MTFARIFFTTGVFPTIGALSLLHGIIGLLAIGFVAIITFELIGLRRHLRAAAMLSIGAALALALLWASQSLIGGAASIHNAASIAGLLRADALTAFFCVIFLAVALLVLLASNESAASYCGSILLSTMGMVLASAANDILLLYLSIELVTAPTYILVIYHKTTQRLEAAVKYFIAGIVASALLLLGVGLLVVSSGTTAIAGIAAHAHALLPSGSGILSGGAGYGTQSLLVILGAVGFLCGLGFKLGLFPFSFWIPDVYQGAPPNVAGFLGGGTKKAAYAAYLRLAVVFAVIGHWSIIIAVIAAVTMTVANIIAILQLNMRRMLAYSIVSQAGFLAIGIACMTHAGYSAAMFHAFTHAFMALGAFIVLGVLFSHRIETLEQVKGMGWRNPLLGASLTIFLLSLAGIPLLAGFASKFSLIVAAVDAGYLWLALLAIANSVVALYYYFRVIRAMYAYDSRGPAYPIRRGVLVALLVCVVMTILVGIMPEPFIRLAQIAASTVF